MIRFTPPLKLKEKRQTKLVLKKVSLLVASTFACSLISVSDLAYAEVLNLIDTTGDSKTLINIDGEKQSYDSLHIKHYAPITNSQFSIYVENSSQLKISGPISGESYSDDHSYVEDTFDRGTYLIYATGNSLVTLDGDIDLTIRHSLESDRQLDSIGANLLYASSGSTITVGKDKNSNVRLWALAGQPDLLSSKKGSTVYFNSVKNQLIGTIDMTDTIETTGSAGKPGYVHLTLSGPTSYWFGDEKTWMNSAWRTTEEYADWGKTSKDIFELELNDGAQWTYFGIDNYRLAYGDHGERIDMVPKHISSITLNGGVINLFDDNIRETWNEIGLWSRLENGQYEMNHQQTHDYVRIGNLKGNGGIFRLDLNGDDKTQSDMVYIEAGEGTHYFEPYNLQLLESITPENTLTFALVAKGSSVQFRDKQNIHGEALVDYELEIAKKEGITEADLANPDNAYWDKTADIIAENADQTDLARKIDMSEFLDGTNWFIRRVTLKESAAAVGMTGAGYASYDAAIEMDRRDRRLSEQVRDAENSDNGLWVRVHHGRSGADNQYRWDRTGATVGIDRQVTENNRLGAYFTYTQGDTEFLDVRGDGDMKRYELAVFDTLELGQHYFDFVGRVGRVSSDFSVGNEVYSTSGDFDQDYAALSAEYGYQLLDTNGVFIEPQLQMQVAYVDGYDYDSERGMEVDVDGETSVIGRVGLRAGREIATSSSNGSFYARADVYHQFTDGQDAVFRDKQDHCLDVNWGDTGTWASFGVGTSWVWKNRLGLQLDVEKVAGGKTEDTWLMSGRFSYLF